MSDPSDNNYDWIVVPIFVAFVSMAMATMVFLASRIPRKRVVSELNVYPIKSCGPMNVKSAKVTPRGFAHDRFAQVSDSQGRYLTPREPVNARLFHVHPTIVNDQQGISQLKLTYFKGGNPSNKTSDSNSNSDSNSDSAQGPFQIRDLHQKIENATTLEATPMIGPKVQLKDLGDDVADWLSAATQIEDCRLTAIGSQYQRSVEVNPDQGEIVPVLEKEAPPVSLADEAPFLLTTASSLHDLNARLVVRGKDAVGMQRFRPNIVLKGTLPWEEDTWKRIRIGGVAFEVWQRCGRCSMTTIDRETLARGPEPLATLSTFRERAKGQRNFGMHMIPIPGTSTSTSTSTGIANLGLSTSSSFLVTVGDELEILEYDEERLKEWKRLFDPY